MTLPNLSKTISVSLGAIVLAMSGATMATANPTIEIKMKDNGYHVMSDGQSGTMTPGFSLSVGEENTVILQNEDATAHDFVSKAFNGLDVVVIGETQTIHSDGATGYRVMPGKSVKLKFTPKVADGFTGGWDVFWCTIHGKANMRGEVILADTRTGYGAF